MGCSLLAPGLLLTLLWHAEAALPSNSERGSLVLEWAHLKKVNPGCSRMGKIKIILIQGESLLALKKRERIISF